MKLLRNETDYLKYVNTVKQLCSFKAQKYYTLYPICALRYRTMHEKESNIVFFLFLANISVFE